MWRACGRWAWGVTTACPADGLAARGLVDAGGGGRGGSGLGTARVVEGMRTCVRWTWHLGRVYWSTHPGISPAKLFDVDGVTWLQVWGRLYLRMRR